MLYDSDLIERTTIQNSELFSETTSYNMTMLLPILYNESTFKTNESEKQLNRVG